MERVQVIGAGWIWARRNGDALIKRPREGSEREIAYQPAIGNMIVQNKRVSAVRTAARCTHQVLKERVECDRGGERVARLIINPVRDIERFDVMIRADVAIGVRRQTTASGLR